MISLRVFCVILYGFYTVSVVLQLFEATLLAGVLALLLTYALNVSKKKKAAAKDTPFESHLQWMIRTFWIGTGVIMPLAFMLGVYLVMRLTDTSAIASAITGGDPDALLPAIGGYFTKNETTITLITYATMAPTIVWWVRRCWRGFVLAKDGEPVEHVKSWL